MAESRSTRAVRRRTAAVAAALLTLAGCASDSAASHPTIIISAPGSTPTTTTADLAPGVPADGEVHLIDPGDLPRQDLHRPPTVGTSQVTMTQSTRVTMASGGEQQSAATPSIIQTVEVSVQPRPDGRFSVSQEVIGTDVGTDGTAAARDEVARSVETLIGMRATGVIDQEGRTSDLDVQLPESAPEATAALFEQMEGTFEQLAVPLPDEPVGDGGSWATKRTIDLLGAEVDVQVVYTLAKVDAEGFTVRSVTTMSIDEEQQISVNGQTGQLLAMAGEGSGVSTLRFGQVAADGRASSRVRQSFEVDGQVLDQDITTEMRIQPEG